MKKTLESLDYLRFLISSFHAAFDDNNRSLIGEPLKFFQIISDEINNIKQNGFISENMAKSYIDMLQEMRENAFGYSDDTEERFNKLQEINNQQIEDCEKADQQISEAFSFNWKNDSAKVEDSKKSLEHIKDLTRFYESGYSKDNQLDSVDVFCELVSGIKEAWENKNISEATAKALIEPLQDIKENIFNDKIRQEKVAEFNQILQTKTSNGKEEKGVFRSIVDGIDSLNVGKNGEKAVEKPDINNNKEQIENFKGLADKIIKKYKRAKVYTDMFLKMDSPKAAKANEALVDVFEPLVAIINKVKDKQKLDKEDLEKFGQVWKNVKKELPNIYNQQDSLRANYDDIWDDMGQFVNLIDTFLKGENLDQKEPNMSALGKEETQHAMTAADATKTQDEADKVLETQRQTSKENPGKGNEQQEKAIREQVSKNQEEKQGIKAEKNHALDPLKKAIDDYRFLLANGFSVYPAWVDLRKEIKASVNEGVITQQKAEELNDILLNYDKASRLEALNEILNNDDYFTDKQYVIKAEKTKDNTDKKQEIKSTAEKEKVESDKSVENLKHLIKEYSDIYKEKGSILYDGVADVWKRMSDAMNYVIEHKLVSKDVEQQLIDVHNFLRTNALRQDLQLEGIERLNHIFDGEQKSVSNTVAQNQAVPQEEKQKDRVRREDYPNFRAGINAIVDKYKDDEPGVQEPNNLLLEQQKEEARRKIESFILNYDNLSSNNPGEANYELDKFSKYISGAMKDGLISQQEAKQYKDIINNAYTSKTGASETVEKLWNLNEKYSTSQAQRTETKTMDSPLEKREDTRSKTIKDVAQKQDEVDKALETQRQASKENPGNGNGQQEKAIREQVVNNEEQKSQDKFAVFRQQLERKVPLERDENTDNKKIDRPEAFKKGSENVKKLAQSNQQKMMAYYMKKRKNEWSDY